MTDKFSLECFTMCENGELSSEDGNFITFLHELDKANQFLEKIQLLLEHTSYMFAVWVFSLMVNPPNLVPSPVLDIFGSNIINFI